MLKHRFTPALFLAAACALPAAPGRAADTIAIMDFTASGASASEAAAISGFVRNAVVRSATYTVVDKKNMDKILQEQAFQQTGCTSQECAVKLGKLLNVKKMIVGEYTMLGGVRFLTASLVDVESSQIERSGKVKGFEVGNADEAADQLVAQLEGKAVPAPVQPQQPVQPVNPQWEQPQDRAWTPAPVAAAPRTPSKGYLALFLGSAAGTISSYMGEATYTWSSGYNEDEKLFSFEIDDMMAESASPALGLRIGAQTGGFAFDVEFSMASVTTPAQSVQWYDTITPSSSNTYSQTRTFNVPEGFLTLRAMAIMFNFYGVINAKGKFNPYIGGGFGITYMGIESETWVDDVGRPLDTGTMAFGLQVPLGFRLWASDNFFFWTEFHPAWHIVVVGFNEGKGSNESEDTFNLRLNQFQGGIGFGF